jgi:uncharacterized protein YwgA
MNPTQLAGLVKRAYPNFDMGSFDYRLKLQKFVYLMKVSNLNLGYDFRLHLRGPYSTMLTRDGFSIDNFDECQMVKFENVESEKRFETLLNFIENKKDDSNTMEIVASLHLFHKLYPDKTDDDLVILVKEKNLEFSSMGEEINVFLDELKNNEVVLW